MPIFIASLIIQVALVVHILKTGRNTTWVFIVMFFPVVGSLAYFIVELWPELAASRAARRARSNLSKVVNPDKGVQQASRHLAVADTVQNAMKLAAECLERGRYAEARELYERCLTGLHADDPHLQLGLAKAQFGLADYAATLATLDQLKEKNPDHRSAEGHLLYARSLEGLARTDEAIVEYQALAGYFPGPEPACRLAMLLKATGRTQEAEELFQRVLGESEIAGRHYNSMHREWVAIARREAGH